MRRDAILALGIGAITPFSFEVGRFLSAWADGRVALLVVPLLSAALFHPLWAGAVARGELRRAIVLAQLWALSCSIVSIVLVARTGDTYRDVLWNAEVYRGEMFHWVRTGVGEESEPARFLPLHASHFLAFAALSLLSFGFLGLALGAALLHYMNFYVGSLVASAASPVAIAFLGWPPYAIVRVIGFVTVATALTAFAHRRFRGVALDPASIRRNLLLGVALVVADALIKTLVAPSWGELLRGLLGGV